MRTAIQVASTINAESTGPCLILHTQQGKKYLIGRFSEGLQRSMSESRIRISKVKNILFTGPLDWPSFGGIPGFLLTVCSTMRPDALQPVNSNDRISTEKIKLHSSPGIRQRLENAVDSWKYFIFHHAIQLHGASGHHVEPEFQDDFISLKGIDLISSDFRDKPSSSFIIQVLPMRGKFLPEKAKELGVPRGFLFAQLAKGESITTPDGNVVHPDQVMEPPGEAPRVLVIDVPSEKYIDSVISQNWTQPLSNNGPKMENKKNVLMRLPPSSDGKVSSNVSVIYHFLGDDLDPFENEKYFNWIQSFGPNVMHFISHKNYASHGISLECAYRLNSDLRRVLPDNFIQPYTRDAYKTFPTTWPNIHNLYRLDAISLEPKIDRYPEAINESGKLPESNQDSSSILDDTNGIIITLGTGSSQPAKYRNVIGTIFNWKGRSILLDCGEGTLGSINRLYTPEVRDSIIAKLNFIYISHLHADHHLGTVSIILEWIRLHKNDDQALYIAGPLDFYRFLKQWSRVQADLDLQRIQFSDLANYLHKSCRSKKSDFDVNVRKQLGLTSLRSCRAIHCDSSYSSGLQFKDSETGQEVVIAYSGDTRPNKRFAEMMQYQFDKCDVLIHEATHEDDLLEDAISKRHSTVSEAIGIGARMHCKALVLTHFSQRYPKLPIVDDRLLKQHNVTIAFDGMHLKLNQAGLQNQHLKELQSIFEEHEITEVEDNDV